MVANINKNNDILEVIKHIQQIVFDASDFAKSSQKEKIGLKREEGHQILNSRIIDGFQVSFINDLLKINYHGEIRLKDIYETKFENEIEQLLANIVLYIKREYKKVTGDSLVLTAVKDSFKVLVQSTSRVRSWVQASCYYKIGNIEISNKDKYMETYAKKFAEWVKQNEKKPSKPKNVTI